MSELGPCLEWQGRRHPEMGYGQLKADGKQRYSHRVMWEDNNGPVPNGLEVMHLCDNPPCFRLDHLALGTHKQNMQHASEAGRLRPRKPTGSQFHPEVVEVIRADTRSSYVIAAEYGVSYNTIWRIKKQIPAGVAISSWRARA